MANHWKNLSARGVRSLAPASPPVPRPAGVEGLVETLLDPVDRKPRQKLLDRTRQAAQLLDVSGAAVGRLGRHG